MSTQGSIQCWSKMAQTQLINRVFSTLCLMIGGMFISLKMPFISLGNSPNSLKAQLCFALIAALIIPYQYWFFKKKRGRGIFYFIVGICFFGFSISILINSIHGLRFATEYSMAGEIHMAQLQTDSQCQSPIKTEILPFAVTSSSTMVILCPYRTNFSTLNYQVIHANIPLNWQEYMKKSTHHRINKTG